VCPVAETHSLRRPAPQRERNAYYYYFYIFYIYYFR